MQYIDVTLRDGGHQNGFNWPLEFVKRYLKSIESFQEIDYPILPRISNNENTKSEEKFYSKRHFTHFTPRDFDLSPSFRVIKPTIERGFNYQDIVWKDPTHKNI